MLVVYFASVVVLGLVIALASQSVVVRETERMERRLLARNLRRAQAVVEIRAADLLRTVEDWAYRDDTYAFVETRSPTYAKSNLTAESMRTLDVHFFVILNNSLTPVWSGAYDAQHERMETGGKIATDPAIRGAARRMIGTRRRLSGILDVQGRLACVAVAPILRIDRGGPPRGALVMGRFLDDAYLARTSQGLEVDVALAPLSTTLTDSASAEARIALERGAGVYTALTSASQGRAYGYLKDPQGKPVAILTVSARRELPQLASRIVIALAAFVLVAGALVAAIVALWVHRYVSRRLKRLSDQMLAVSLEAESAARVELDGNDELTGLARRADAMLERIRDEHHTVEDNRRRYEQLFENMPQSCAVHEMVYDAEGRAVDYRFLQVNGAFCSMLGVQAKDVVGRTLREVFPGIEPQWLERYREVVETGEPVVFEERSERLGKDFLVSAFRTEPGRFAVVFVDVSERNAALRRLEASEANVRELLAKSEDSRTALLSILEDQRRTTDALARSEAQYRAYANASPDLVFLKDSSFRYLSVNEANCRFFGRREEEILGKTDFDLMPEEAARACRASDEAALRAGDVLVTTEEVGDRIYEVRKFPVALGDSVGVGGVIADVTDRVRMAQMNDARAQLLDFAAGHSLQETLRQALDIVERLTHSAGAVYDEVDEERGVATIVAYSTRTSELCGVTTNSDRHMVLANAGVWADCVGERRPVIHNDFAALPHRKELPEGHQPLVRQLAVPIERQGRTVGILSVCNKPTDYTERDADVVRFVGDVVWEIEHRKRAEEEAQQLQAQLAQAEKMEAIGTLAGGVAHDFNNILTIIGGSCEEALGRLGPHDGLRPEIERARAAVDRGTRLTQALLAFGRQQPLRLEPLDVNQVVADLMAMLRPMLGEDIGLDVVLAQETVVVEADRAQIERILMNLATNARDAMPRGGKLTIETAVVFHDEDYVRTHPYTHVGEYVMLAVSDTGIGMDEETKKHAFEPFFTTKAPGRGTGLGLAGVFGAVKQMGGSIEVYSELGQGTTFRVYLPRVHEKLTEAPPPKPVIRGSGQRVLVIEDDEPVRETVVRMLRDLGYEPVAAESGAAALALVREGKLRPDAVLTDVIMPEMNGKVVAEELRKVLPGLRVLFMSGYTDNAIVHHGVLESGVPFVAKPLTRDGLAVALSELLQTPETTPAPAGLRILVVDDEEPMIELVVRAAKQRGYTAVGATDGKRALEALAVQSFDVILMDMNIPGTNTERLLEAIRAAGHTAPVVYHTGYADVKISDHERELGVVGVLEKAGRMRDMMDRLQKILAGEEEPSQEWE